MTFAPYITETPEVANKNVIHSTIGLVVDGVTVVSGTPNVVPGRVLGRITASGKYANYNNANVDGTEVARCIALNFADTTTQAKDMLVHVALHGVLVLDQLVGLDAAGVTDFNGREDSAFNIFVF